MIAFLRWFVHWLAVGLKAFLAVEALLWLVWALLIAGDWLTGGDWPNG